MLVGAQQPQISPGTPGLQNKLHTATLMSTRHLVSSEELESTHPNLAPLRKEHPSPSRAQDVELGVLLDASLLILASYLSAGLSKYTQKLSPSPPGCPSLVQSPPPLIWIPSVAS